MHGAYAQAMPAIAASLRAFGTCYTAWAHRRHPTLGYWGARAQLPLPIPRSTPPPRQLCHHVNAPPLTIAHIHQRPNVVTPHTSSSSSSSRPHQQAGSCVSITMVARGLRRAKAHAIPGASAEPLQHESAPCTHPAACTSPQRHSELSFHLTSASDLQPSCSHRWSPSQANASQGWLSALTRQFQPRCRPLLLASLSTSSLAQTAAPGSTPGFTPGPTQSTQRALPGLSGAAARGTVNGGEPGPSGTQSVSRRVWGVPRLVSTLLGLSPEFVATQAMHEQVYRVHMAHNGLFTRPCPHCGSAEFFLPDPDNPTPSPSSPAQTPPLTSQPGSLHVGPSLVDGSGAVPVWFQTRPLVCEQCQRWSHFGCMGIDYLEEVPARPWFHCSDCRRTHVKIEALRRRGEMLMPRPQSAGGPLTFTFATPNDLSAFLARVQADLLNPDGRQGSALGRAAGRDPAAAGYGVLPALELLGASGLRRQVVERVMDPAGEYDAGRYALVLRRDARPVAAATFNVLQPGLPAQVGLVAAADGCHEPLFQVLESALATELGITSVLAQPQPGLTQEVAKGLGYRALTPTDLAELHMVMPVSFWDAPVLGKHLV